MIRCKSRNGRWRKWMEANKIVHKSVQRLRGTAGNKKKEK